MGWLSLHRTKRRWRWFATAVQLGLRDSERDYTRGPINTAVMLLAIPMVLEMTLESVFAVVDMFFVARLGSDAVAAVGLTEAVITTVYAVAIGLSMGTTAMVSRRIGEKDPDAAGVAAVQSLWLGVIVSAIVAISGIVFAEDILRLMGAGESVIADGANYTLVMLGGSVSIMYLFLLNAIFRGAGDATIAMRSLWLANGINIVLDPLLIFGLGPFPELGVMGAAVATTIGRSIGVIYQFAHLFGWGGRIRLHARALRPHLQVMLRLARLSVGGIGQFLIGVASWIFLMRIVAFYGSGAIAGYAIAVRIIDFTFLPAWGLGNAAATLVGQNLGAGQPERAERSIWRAAQFNCLMLSLFAMVMLLLAPQLIGLFSTEPDVMRYGADALRFFAYGYPLFALGMIALQSLNGAGDTFTPTLINFVAFWLLQIPLAWWLAQTVGMGPRGVFWAILVSEAVFSVIAIWVIRRGHWKKVAL